MKRIIGYLAVSPTLYLIKILVLVVCFISSSGAQAQQSKSFVIQQLEAQPGQTVSGKLIVEKGIDQGTFIPVTIINGENPGPVLTLSAGIHGTEYVPIIALQELVNEIDPKDLSGTVILVHVANIPAFLNRSVYTGPIDQKNLNRVFPGKEDGTLSERIAFTIFNEISSKSDYYIDLHGGEFNESLLNHIYLNYGAPDPLLDEKTRMLAHAMGNYFLIPFDCNSVSKTESAQYSDFAAFRKGVASITIETGDQGKVDVRNLELVKNGILNVIKTIGMLEGEIVKNEHPVYLIDEKFIKSNFDGIFYSCVDKGQPISTGTLIGYTTDFRGVRIEEYHAPYSGIVVRTIVSPAIKKGETVIRLGKVSDTFESE